MDIKRLPNSLLSETSLYLRQHAYNPVQWFPWSDAILKRAADEKRMMIISIGYSACHWCHVMEREVFEKEEAAALMNANFICIKVDREERPDVDQVYMKALQLMNGQGGWPLNIFALPDGRPVYGGTYFPLKRWLSVCDSVLDLNSKHPEQLEAYATRLLDGMQQYRSLITEENKESGLVSLSDMVGTWKDGFDPEHGGSLHVPKFPMPDNYLFLLRYGYQTGDQQVLRHVEKTLYAMALGGMRDWVGGGFSRYSVDAIWKVPHFEKMLYDNAQLLCLYAEASAAFHDVRFAQEAADLVTSVFREFRSPDGLYYSAIDADSEGIEGKYYCYTFHAFQELCGDDFEIWKSFFDIRIEGNWEHELNILHPVLAESELCKIFSLDEESFNKKKAVLKSILLQNRLTRVPPARDEKIITCWNALMVSGLIRAAQFCNEPGWLYEAMSSLKSMKKELASDERLLHQSSGSGTPIFAFLDDYAAYIHACLDLFEASMHAEWYEEALKWTALVLDQFDTGDLLFYYAPDDQTGLIFREIDTQDNVIPSSNAMMAGVLLRIGVYAERTEYIARAEAMVNRITQHWAHYPSAYSCWAGLKLRFESPGGWILADYAYKADYAAKPLPYKPNQTILFTDYGTALPPYFQNKIPGISHCGIKACLISTQSWDEFIQHYEKY